MAGRKPHRYGIGDDGRPQRLWNGKLPEDFSEQDIQDFIIDTDTLLRESRKERKYMAKSNTKNAPAPEPEKTAVFTPEARAYPLEKHKGSIIAHASITIAEGIGAQHIDIVNGRNGVFVSMPSKKGADGKYYDTVFPFTTEARKNMHTLVLDAYIKAAEKDYPELATLAKTARDDLNKESLTKRIKDAAKETKAQPEAAKDKPEPTQEAAL